MYEAHLYLGQIQCRTPPQAESSPAKYLSVWSHRRFSFGSLLIAWSFCP